MIFPSGEFERSIRIPIIESPLWSATMEFKVLLEHPIGCQLLGPARDIIASLHKSTGSNELHVDFSIWLGYGSYISLRGKKLKSRWSVVVLLLLPQLEQGPTTCTWTFHPSNYG